MTSEQYTVEMPDGGTVKVDISSNKYKLDKDYFNLKNPDTLIPLGSFYIETTSHSSLTIGAPDREDKNYDLDFNQEDNPKSGFFLEHLNFKSNKSKEIQFNKANFGVINRDSSLWCVFIPIYGNNDNSISDQSIEVAKDLFLKINNKKKQTIAPQVFVSKLDQDKKKNVDWFCFLQWESNYLNKGNTLNLFKDYFKDYFGNSTLCHQMFPEHGASPFNHLPSITGLENTFPISCFKFPKQGSNTQLKPAFCSILLGGNIKDISFDVSLKSTSDQNKNKIELFKAKADLLIPNDDWVYKNKSDTTLKVKNLPQFFKCVDLIESQQKSGGGSFVFELKFSSTELLNEYTFVNGAIEFKKNNTTTETSPTSIASLTFKVSGIWDHDTINLSPSFELENLPCTFSYSPLTDLAAQNNNAIFDTNSLQEDELHREGGVVLGEFTPINENSKENKEQSSQATTLNIRIKTQKNRNAIVEWSIKGKQKSDPTKKPKALCFQAKPFSVAQIELPDHEAEGGEQIAFWRSDDPEGPQWRVADSEMTIHLPPQAVGEEMERGNRFWPKNNEQPPKSEPYIKPEKPVRYRFSPPTTLTVMPGTKVRRYNAVPNNLQSVLKEAVVKSFDTEIVYPINTKFEVNSEGLPHIRISETAFFTGKPTENLPVYPAENELRSFYQDVLADEIGEYTYHSKDKKITSIENNPKLSELFKESYKSTRLAHSAVRANWASRIAQYHLYDPYRADGKLMLSQGLTFKIRSTKEDAPPLLSPLPNGVELEQEDLERLQAYLNKNGSGQHDFLKEKEDIERLGALRAGVIYTMEFPSVLYSVLTSNDATSTEGIIEELSFTPLGANGYISVEFDEGRTIFKARVHHGQISRLENIRIGRLGVLWNKARHVIVYERTTVPSEQFKGEQSSEFDGWPIIRKTEEYIEPIEIKRKFDTEPSKEINACGFIESSEFISQKIYVNSAWGKNYEHGYEIPLWKSDETNSVYVKPSLALNAHAGIDETTRQLLDEPQYLYFYSNTQAGTGKDSNNWQAQVEIDLPSGLCRLPVITGAHLKGDSQKIISTKEMPQPNTSVAARRPRFDLAVKSAGPVNLQHKRGETQMLAAMQVISMARTGESKATINEDFFNKISLLRSSLEDATLKNLHESTILQEISNLTNTALELLKQGQGCNYISDYLSKEKVVVIDKLKSNLDSGLEQFKKLELPKITADFIKNLLGIKVNYPSGFIAIQFKKYFKDADDYLSQASSSTDSQLKAEVQNALKPILELFKSVKADINKNIGYLESLQTSYELPNIKCDVDINQFKDSLKELIDNSIQTKEKFNKLIGRYAYIDFLVGLITSQLNWLTTICNSLLDNANEISDDLKRVVDEINKNISTINDLKSSSLDALIIKLKGVVCEIKAKEDELEYYSKLEVGKIKEEITELIELIKKELDKTDSMLEQEANNVQQEFNVLIDNLANELEGKWITAEETFNGSLVEIAGNLNKVGSSWINKLEKALDACVDEINKDCTYAAEKINELEKKAKEFVDESKKEISDYVQSIADSVIDRNTQQKIQELSKNYEAKAESGIKLFKAIGDLPKLPSLDFNALAAEYVFGDVDKFIETSPYAVKLKEIDSALNGLGITLPSSQLLDQIVPSSLNGLNFRDVFNNMGGMDFKHLFDKFKLDDRLKPDNIKIAHGLDKETRQAWVKASVNAELPEKQLLFDVMSIGVSTTNLKLNAVSEQRVDLQGKRQSTNKGKFISDFALDFSGNKLAVFKEVTISFDNGKFDFDISPDKIELHPSIKFVSEIAKQIQGNLPPYIEVVKDDKGNTKGVRSSMNIEVANPPDFGAVKIGTLILYSGIQLEMTEKGFQISSLLSVGRKETPIFLQIGMLGGGMWLETTATQIGPTTQIQANLGLAVGSTRRINVAGVATGEYSILLFAYAQYLISGPNTQSQFKAGVSFYGSARILSIANATVYMLLEAIHDSKQGSKGRGLLDVSISMGRFYSINIKQQVEQQI